MKKIKLLLTLSALFFVLFSTSCKKEEEAKAAFDFVTFDDDKGTVNFTNQSINASTFEWDFGDGNKSRDQNPRHLFWRKGDYQVTLMAKSESGKSTNFVTKKVTVIIP